MKKADIEKRTEEIVLPFINEHNFELFDVEYVKEGGSFYLRVYLDKEGGINIDDCEITSRFLSEKLDEEDYIEESYILEVSSPGLGRPLKKEKDFKRSLGEEVEVKTYRAKAVEGYGKGVKDFSGILTEYDPENGNVTITDSDGTDILFEKAEIAIIRLAIDF